MVVAFETLFLGLVFGYGPIQLMVGPQVAAVELRLDRKKVTELAGSPWTCTVNLGPRPQPHDLLAVARDASGSELGRARQRINLPRPEAEVNVVLQRNADGTIAALLSWDESHGREPKSIEATLDGTPLSAGESDRLALPFVDLSIPHVLSVELTFPRGARARADVAFGGDLVEAVRSELTAVPVVPEPGVRLPPPASMQGWFAANGSPLPVVGSERGAAEVVFVFDQHAAGRLRGCWVDNRSSASRNADLAPGSQDDRFSVVMPTPAGVVGRKADLRNLFPIVGPATLDSWTLNRVSLKLPFDVSFQASQPLGNAVCLAGIHAVAKSRRRAVVLVLASNGLAGGTVSPDAARAFLADLRVPFRVWSIEDEPQERADTAWGPAGDVSLRKGLDQAMAKLIGDLDGHRIVWLEGSWLPQDVVLTAQSRGLRLAE